jgi:hypothetical protein
MNLAIGVSGRSPKAFNCSSEIEEQCPQLKHSTTIRFIPGMWARTASRQRASLAATFGVHVRFTPESGHVRCNERCLLRVNSGHSVFHSITSLALANSAGGTVRPSALAVLRLITNSYLVGACTGISPGFSPLRMRST